MWLNYHFGTQTHGVEDLCGKDLQCQGIELLLGLEHLHET